MKILLVNPPSNLRTPNLGLLYLAGALTKSSHQTLLLDLAAIHCDDYAKTILQLARVHNIGHVGFSVCDVNYQITLDITASLKQAGLYVFLGGPQVNSLGRRVLEESPLPDTALMGECEESIHTYITHLEGNVPARDVPGLIWREDGTVKFRPPKASRGLSIVDIPDYGLLGIESLSGYMLLTSRGCPYHCRFCCRNTGSQWRPRPIDECIKEIEEAVRKWNIQSFRVIDATFNLQPKRVVDFCRLLRQRDLDLPWMVSGMRADLITKESINALRDAGCLLVAMGVESIDPHVFSWINKGETLENIRNAIDILKECGLPFACYMIHGLPGDNYERSIHYARELQNLSPNYVMYNQAIPFAGTELFSWVQNNATMNSDFSWNNIRSMNSVAYHTADFTEQERLVSFQVIQTITKVINFSNGQAVESFDEIKKFIDNFDPEYRDYHLHYIENTIPAKMAIKQNHRETEYAYRLGYSGCTYVGSGDLVVVPDVNLK